MNRPYEHDPRLSLNTGDRVSWIDRDGNLHIEHPPYEPQPDPVRRAREVLGTTAEFAQALTGRHNRYAEGGAIQGSRPDDDASPSNCHPGTSATTTAKPGTRYPTKERKHE